MDKLRREEQASASPVGGMVMVRLKKGEERPAGAVLMTDHEVLRMQHQTILNWQPRSEMWPFSWGMGILGGTSALSGMFINNVCRQKLGLMSMGRLATYTPTVAVPVIISTFFHNFLVTNKILVGEFPCTVCAAVRSGSLQSAAGGLYPMLLGPMMCVAMARKHHTYYIPALQDRAQILPFLRRIMPSPAALLAVIVLNFGVGMAISERETLLFAKYLCPSTMNVRKASTEEELFQ